MELNEINLPDETEFDENILNPPRAQLPRITGVLSGLVKLSSNQSNNALKRKSKNLSMGSISKYLNRTSTKSGNTSRVSNFLL